jgi:hypothetical protein
MRGYKPDHRIWKRVNEAILNENAASVVTTLISGLCAIIVDSGACRDERHARVHLAAMLLSPDTDPKPGSLAAELPAELARLDDGKWII